MLPKLKALAAGGVVVDTDALRDPKSGTDGASGLFAAGAASVGNSEAGVPCPIVPDAPTNCDSSETRTKHS